MAHTKRKSEPTEYVARCTTEKGLPVDRNHHPASGADRGALLPAERSAVGVVCLEDALRADDDHVDRLVAGGAVGGVQATLLC